MISRATLIAALLVVLPFGIQPALAEVVKAEVSAVTETGPIDGDADDPAIWVNPDNPEASLVLGTDKTKGLFVFDLSGNQVGFFEDGELNNVDIRPFVLNGEKVWLASAAERIEENLVFYLIHADGQIEHATPFAFPGAPAELAGEVKDIYGSAMQADPETGRVFALVNYKSGDVIQWEVTEHEGQLSLAFARHLKVETQPEGMASDDRAGHIYVGEEDVAIWRFDGLPDGSNVATQIDAIPSQCFPKDDIEGLSVYDDGQARYLVASAQGINKVAVYDLNGDDIPSCIGLVEIAAGNVDGVSETDGLDVVSAPLGTDYPNGMLVMMDDQNEMFSTNFKYISWADIAGALALN